jgi:acyl carrier protein
VNEQLYQTVANILVEKLRVEPVKITAEAKLVADLAFDSLDEVELGRLLGNTFNVEVTDGELADIATVGDIIALLSHKGASTP